MAKKATITDVSSGYASGTTLDANFDALNDKFDNTLSRDGSTPNQMEADFDMNSNDILNTRNGYFDRVFIGGELASLGGLQQEVEESQQYTGDGSTINFTLPFAPTGVNALRVYIDGICQYDDTYTVAAGTLTFSEAPPNGAAIQVFLAQNVATLDLSATTINTGDAEMQSDDGKRFVEFSTVAQMLATTLNYTQAPAGTYFRVLDGDYTYKVAASGASDHNLTTTGGSLKLYAVDGGSGVSLAQLGWSSGDIATALTAALEGGFKHIRLAGTMTLASEINEAVTDLRLTFEPGSTITYTGSAGANRMIELTGVNTLIVDGQVTMDCDLKVAHGIFVRALNGAERVDIAGVKVIDVFQTSPATYGAGGVTVLCDTGTGRFAKVSRCTVENVSRDVSGGTCVGIAVTDFDHKVVTDNYIDGVHTGNGSADADGVKVFDQITASAYSTGLAIVENNIVMNCEGRFVKTQVQGGSSVTNNYFTITEALALITSFRLVDAQVDGGEIVNNTFEVDATWTGGADFFGFYLRAPDVAPDFTGQLIKGSVRGNKILVPVGATDISRIVYLGLGNLATRAYTVKIDVTDNSATTTAGWGGGSCGVYGVTVKAPVSFVAGATAQVRIENNDLETTAFIEGLDASGGTAAHGGLGDLTGKLFLTVRGNSNPSASAIALMDYTSNECFTSSIFVENNAVGTYSNWWQPPFDFAEILGGEFYLNSTTTPAHANGPASYTFSLVSRRGRHLLCDMYGGGKANKTLSLTAIGAATSWT